MLLRTGAASSWCDGTSAGRVAARRGGIIRREMVNQIRRVHVCRKRANGLPCRATNSGLESA